MAGYDAVLVLSFGGPEGPNDVIPFLENVTRGRNVPRARLDEVAARYMDLGGISPINEQCRRLVTALQSDLLGHQIDLPVYWGNRNWRPMLVDTVREMARNGVTKALAVTTSAYSSYSSCRQYLEDIEAARSAVGPSAPVIDKIRAYYDHPGFINPFVSATRRALNDLDDLGRNAHLVFTAHSIPLAMAQQCDYEVQIAEAARLVATQQDSTHDWSIAWQSRSGPPQVPWLEPDINDHLRKLRDTGVSAATIVPIGFVSDHVEVLFDLDDEAARTASEIGLKVTRAGTPATAPDDEFITMWRQLVEERLDAESPCLGNGSLGLRPNTCPTGCCISQVRYDTNRA